MSKLILEFESLNCESMSCVCELRVNELRAERFASCELELDQAVSYKLCQSVCELRFMTVCASFQNVK